MNNNNTLVCFEEGSQWLRADFHLHTKADKEFSYQDNDNEFVRRYVEALKQAGIGVGVITNHNKFNDGEFKACLLYTSPSPRDPTVSRMPSSA